jgi:small subunit ribosomal protein S11
MTKKTEKTAKTAKLKEIKPKVKKQLVSGRVYVTSTFNNTLVSFTDSSGNVVAQGSCGASGFKGARKSTPFAATTVMEGLAQKVSDLGMREVEVYIKGPGAGRDAALRVLKTMGFSISMIADVTPIPHNGPRPKKERRV